MSPADLPVKVAAKITYGLLADKPLPIAGAARNDQLDHVAERCANRPNCVNPAHLDRVTARENSVRYRRTQATSSRFTGVNRTKHGWRVEIMIDGHRRHVGVFRDEVAAANAYDAALITAGLAPVNFPEVAS